MNHSVPVPPERRRGMTLLPWVLLALAVALAAAEYVITQQSLAAQHGAKVLNWIVAIDLSLPTIAFAAVGTFVVIRRPGNRVGWLLIAVGLGFILGLVANDYPGATAQIHHSTRPLGTLAAWVASWIWPLYAVPLLLLLLLYPTGKLPSARWKPVLWFGVASLILASALGAIRRGPIGYIPMDNPYGFVSIPDPVAGAVRACAIAAMAAGVLSLVVRFRTAHGEVRQQLKWFTYGAALAIALYVGAIFTTWQSIVGVLGVAATACLPIFMGIAILRYRLYDIDVLINQTLVYGSLTIALGSLYVVGVVVLQAMLRDVTGQGSGLAVAISTLAIAALFQPLRRRIQGFIDRRFYRRKYDAARTLARFGERVRDDVDLEGLTSDMLGVVQETMEPAHVSLWLRPSKRT